VEQNKVASDPAYGNIINQLSSQIEGPFTPYHDSDVEEGLYEPNIYIDELYASDSMVIMVEVSDGMETAMVKTLHFQNHKVQELHHDRFITTIL
jgi:hypothetical protein